MSNLASVFEFKKKEKPVEKFYWSIVFECSREEVLSVKINDVEDAREDRLRVVECLRHLADDIEADLGA
jgi:hypothetical protein